MGNEESKPAVVVDDNKNNPVRKQPHHQQRKHSNTAKQVEKKVFEPVKEFFEPASKGAKEFFEPASKGAKEFFEPASKGARELLVDPAKSFFDDLTNKQRELIVKLKLNNQRFITRTKDGLNLRKKLFNPPITKFDIESYRPPKYEKTPEETLFLLNALRDNFILNHLDNTELSSLTSAFEKVEFETGVTIMKQGNKEANYFFIIYSGFCIVNVDGKDVGNCSSGDGFGDLALLYSCPRVATVFTTTHTVCFRIEKQAFRVLVMSQKQRAETDKIELLQKIPFLADLDASHLKKLSSAMVLKGYEQGDYLIRKGDLCSKTFHVIYDGNVKVTDFDMGGTTDMENLTEGPGFFYGERAIMATQPTTRPANVIALGNVSVYSIDEEAFKAVVGDLSHLMRRSRDKTILSSVDCLKNTFLEESTIDILASLIEEKTFPIGSNIMTEGHVTEPALYIVRSGQCKISSRDGTQNDTIELYGTFGSDHLTMDAGKSKLLMSVDFKFVAGYTVLAVEETVCGVLKLKDCRTVFDTTRIGEGKAALSRKSQIEDTLQLTDVTKHKILGEGSFGQVWLVSAEKRAELKKLKSSSERLPFAMKIQSKYDLIQSGQVDGVINELEIMSQLQHPFLLPLVKTFQDKHFVYMLLGIVQGGELSLRIYSKEEGVLPEKEARFYAAGIVEALSFMHQKHIIHRDLKPENVLIDTEGYPVIIDFGFAKEIPENKTYTFCGTPLYIAPEIILNRGHNAAADHWSYGCIIYEMLVGCTPFYEADMEQMDLYKAICMGKFAIQPLIPYLKVLDLVTKLFVVEPTQRLGSLARGQIDILRHEWFYEIDFALLRRKQVSAPWLPEVADALDAASKDCSNLKDKTMEKRPDISEKDQEKFDLFGII